MDCPIPKNRYDKIQMSHGAGGKLSNDLIHEFIIKNLKNQYLNGLHDGAIFEINNSKLAITTDSYVVNPIFFPGGNIGDLAINGTINDLAMCGAKPLFLSLAFILEENFSLIEFEEILKTINKLKDEIGIEIITGDTKVVEKGKGDKIYINTTGVGKIIEPYDISKNRIKDGDKIILSGTIADHGMAILTTREGLKFESQIKSDTASLNKIIQSLSTYGNKIKFLRDPTRGGLSSCLNEIVSDINFGIKIYEDKIPINENTKAACEILGIDPLVVANEGKFILISERECSDEILLELKKNEISKNASIVGEITNINTKKVVMETILGTERIIDWNIGEQLPRIC